MSHLGASRGAGVNETQAELRRLRAQVTRLKREVRCEREHAESLRQEVLGWRGYNPSVWRECYRISTASETLAALCRAAGHAELLVTLHHLSGNELSVRVARRPGT